MDLFRTIISLLAGRWQLPLAVVALLVAAVALQSLRPTREPAKADVLVAGVMALGEAGAIQDAADAAANLLASKPPLPLEHRASLNEYLAQLLYRYECQRPVRSRRNLEVMLKHHQEADRLGVPQAAARALRWAQGTHWLGDLPAARREYRNVLNLNPSVEDRRTARQALVDLLDGDPSAEQERDRCLESLLTEDNVAPAYAWWALRRAIETALDRDDAHAARTLMATYAEPFKRSDLKGYYDFLMAWILVHEGRFAEAEPLIESVDAWLAEHPRTDDTLDRAGYLPALNLWLAGRVDLGEDRPQLALADFEQALSIRPPQADLHLFASIGRCEALAMLERNEAARDAMHAVINRLRQEPSGEGGLARARVALGRLFEHAYQSRDYGSSIRFLELMEPLIPARDETARTDALERLAKIAEEAADQEPEGEQARAFRQTAGRAYEQAAAFAVLDEQRMGALLWSSARQFELGGWTRDARRMLLRFVEGRTVDPRLPPALLELGRAFEAAGDLDRAVHWYERLIVGFPNLEEAARARLRLASCYLTLGGDREKQAERELLELLEDEKIAPQAQVFRDALYSLCDMLYEQGRYAEVISRLEDFIALYPSDDANRQVRFILADAYRRSAYRLRDEPPAGAPAEKRAAESRDRFVRAAQLFADYLAAGSGSGPTHEVYQRLALFYRADCLYELNEAETLAEALASYRQAAARYQGTPAALSAQVQVANVLLRIGRPTEAARAVERARWMLRNISDRAFEEFGDGTDRAYWDRYLGAVASSDLFAGVFEESP